MEKRVRIALFVILAAFLILVIFQILINGNKTSGFAVQGNEENADNPVFINSIITAAVDFVNSEQKYRDFIRDGKYHSVQIVIGDMPYYIKYNDTDGMLYQTGKLYTDFTIKITKNKFNNLVLLFNGGYYQDAFDYFIQSVPAKVKISVERECMITDWCSQLSF